MEPAGTTASGPHLVPERADRPGAGEAQRRQQADRERRGEHQQAREGEHAGVGCEVHVREPQEGGGRREPRRPPRGQPAEHAAAEREGGGFDEDAPDEAPAAGTHRRADCEIALPGGAAREHHAREVRADDEQHEGAGCQKRGEANGESPFGSWRAAGRTTQQWRCAHGWCPGTPSPAVRTPSPPPRSPRRQSRPAGAGRALPPRTRCDWQPSSPAPPEPWILHQRHPEIRRGLPDPMMPERLGRDADHRVGRAVERDDGSQDVRPASEGVPPQLVADDGDGVLAGADVLRRLERATESGPDSEHREVAGRGVHGADALGGVADHERSITHLPARDRLDRRAGCPDVLQVGVASIRSWCGRAMSPASRRRGRVRPHRGPDG